MRMRGNRTWFALDNVLLWSNIVHLVTADGTSCSFFYLSLMSQYYSLDSNKIVKFNSVIVNTPSWFAIVLSGF